MKKIFAILIVVSLLAVSITGLTAQNEAEESNLEFTYQELSGTGESYDDIIIFDGREYYCPPLPEKTPEQLNKMIQNPEPTVAISDLPSAFSWKSFGGDWSTPARDQQNCGSCWDFAAMGTFEPAINIAKGDPDFDPVLSTQYVMSCLPAAGSCSGGWMSEAIAYAYSTSPGSMGNGINGVPRESCMPYTATDYIPCDDKCPDWDYKTDPPAEDNVLFEVLDYGITSGNPNDPAYWDLMKTWIITYGPISTDIYASGSWSSFWNSHHSPTDVYEGLETGSYTNHGNIIHGWVDDASVHNGGYFIVENTWGQGFGYGGFHNLAYGCLMLGDRDLTWCTAPAWPEAEEEDPINPIHPVRFVYSGWSYGPQTPKVGTEIEFLDESRGPVVLWTWDFDGDGEWDVSGDDYSAKTPEWTYNSEGSYQVTLEVWASSGLSNTLTKNIVVKENWPPTAVSEPAKYGGKDHVIYFEGRNSYDADGQITSYAWDFNGDGNTDVTQPYYTYTYPDQNGEYDATLTVTDNEGMTNTIVIPVKIDKTVPPETSIIAGCVDWKDTLWFNDKVMIELRTTDWSGISKFNFKVDDYEWIEKYVQGELEYSILLNLKREGLHEILYYGTDIYGNIAPIETSSIGIDRVNPSVDYSLDGNMNNENIYITPVEVTITGNDADSGVETISYKVDNDDWMEYTSSFTINQGGIHNIELNVIDKAGNSAQDSFTVQLEYGPSTPLISGPNTGKPNIEYRFSFTSYDEENDQISYYVDWGDGTNTGWSDYVNSWETKSFSHSWTTETQYTIKAKAKDTQGAESDWATQTITLPKAKYFIFYRFFNNHPLLQQLLTLPFFQKILEI
jgi:PKD repeat protein